MPESCFDDGKFVDDFGRSCAWWALPSHDCGQAASLYGLSSFGAHQLLCHCGAACSSELCRTAQCYEPDCLGKILTPAIHRSLVADRQARCSSGVVGRARLDKCDFGYQCTSKFCCPTLRICLDGGRDVVFLSSGTDAAVARLVSDADLRVISAEYGACSPDAVWKNRRQCLSGADGFVPKTRFDLSTCGCKSAYLLRFAQNAWASCKAVSSLCLMQKDASLYTFAVEVELLLDLSTGAPPLTGGSFSDDSAATSDLARRVAADALFRRAVRHAVTTGIRGSTVENIALQDCSVVDGRLSSRIMMFFPAGHDYSGEEHWTPGRPDRPRGALAMTSYDKTSSRRYRPRRRRLDRGRTLKKSFSVLTKMQAVLRIFRPPHGRPETSDLSTIHLRLSSRLSTSRLSSSTLGGRVLTPRDRGLQAGVPGRAELVPKLQKFRAQLEVRNIPDARALYRMRQDAQSLAGAGTMAHNFESELSAVLVVADNPLGRAVAEGLVSKANLLNSVQVPAVLVDGKTYSAEGAGRRVVPDQGIPASTGSSLEWLVFVGIGMGSMLVLGVMAWMVKRACVRRRGRVDDVSGADEQKLYSPTIRDHGPPPHDHAGGGHGDVGGVMGPGEVIHLSTGESYFYPNAPHPDPYGHGSFPSWENDAGAAAVYHWGPAGSYTGPTDSGDSSFFRAQLHELEERVQRLFTTTDLQVPAGPSLPAGGLQQHDPSQHDQTQIVGTARAALARVLTSSSNGASSDMVMPLDEKDDPEPSPSGAEEPEPEEGNDAVFTVVDDSE